MSILGLIFRSVKGSRLTATEGDTNIDKLQKASVGLSGFRGLVGNTTSTTAFQFKADKVKLVDDDNNMIVKAATSYISVSTATAGPAVNGRDQSGAFAVSSWIHLFAIYNPTTDTLAGILSASSTKPMMPSGYVHYAYTASLRLDASGNLIGIYLAGTKQRYASYGQALITGVLSGSEQPLANFPIYVPAKATVATVIGFLNPVSDTSGYIDIPVYLRVISGGANIVGWNCRFLGLLASTSINLPIAGMVPNYNNSLIIVTPGGTGTSAGAFLYCDGFEVPNGA